MGFYATKNMRLRFLEKRIKSTLFIKHLFHIKKKKVVLLKKVFSSTFQEENSKKNV